MEISSGTILKILFNQNTAFLTTDKFLNLNQIGLPEVACRFNSPTCWNIKVIKHFASENRLFCEILSYQEEDNDFDNVQTSLTEILNKIEKIRFRNIDTSKLLKSIAGPVTFSPSKYIEIDNEFDHFETDIFINPIVEIKSKPDTKPKVNKLFKKIAA